MNDELIKAAHSDPALSDAWANMGLAGYRGSLAHGTMDDETDDVDIIGAFLGPKTNYVGLTHIEHVERVCVHDKYDFCLYELKKYFKLLLKGNPNVLTLLFTPDNLWLVKTAWGKKLLMNRHLFISKQLHKTFGGYAIGQLKRMTRPCTEQAFMGAKRRERFTKFGYDCKHASHCIRLLRMGIEALSTFELNVHRHDASELLDIKQGKWSIGRVQTEVGRLRGLLDEALIKSELPTKPDFAKAENLLVEIVEEEHFSKKG